jgi:hypothetical protein
VGARALAAVGVVHVNPQTLQSLLERLGQWGVPGDLNYSIDQLLTSMHPSATRHAAEIAIALMQPVRPKSARREVLRYALFPLAQRGDQDCVELLIELLGDDEVGDVAKDWLKELLINRLRGYAEHPALVSSLMNALRDPERRVHTRELLADLGYFIDSTRVPILAPYLAEQLRRDEGKVPAVSV